MRKRYLLGATLLVGVGLAMLGFDLLDLDRYRSEPPASRGQRPNPETHNHGQASGHEGRSPSATPARGMSPYQADVAAHTLTILDEMERNARKSGETLLLTRVNTERARVLRAATGLPKTPPAQSERNEP